MHGWLTTAEVAEKLGVTAGRVRQLIIDGRLPVVKLGRDNLIRESDLELVKNRKPGRRPKKVAASKKTTNRREAKSKLKR